MKRFIVNGKQRGVGNDVGFVPTQSSRDGLVSQREAKATYEVLHGDCTEVLQEFPDRSVDLVVTDPPYIARYRDRTGRSVSNDDNAVWLAPAFREMYRLLRNNRFCVSFYGWTHTDLFFDAWKSAGFRVVGHITFPKRYTSTVRLLRYQHESAYLLAKGYPSAPEHVIGDVIDWVDYTGNKLHPTQKPLGILTPIIESFSRPGDMVLDPFAGSGSILAASMLTGRRAVGVELEAENVRIATERLVHVARCSNLA